MEKASEIFHYRLATEEDKITGSDAFNMKRRFVYCQYCKFYIETNLADAQCGKCNSNMIELLPRMTYTNEQLAGSDS